MPINEQAVKDITRDQFNRGFLALSLVLMVVLLIDIVVPIYPNDLWPYMRIGEEILRTRAIPTTEFMTFTQFGQPAVYLFWLPSLIFLGVFKLGGPTLISVLSSLSIATFYFLLWLCLRQYKVGFLTSAGLLLFSIITSIESWSIRPQTLAFPLFGLALLTIIKWQKGNNQLLWLLPLVTLVWTNLHASFIVVFLLAGPAILFGKGNKKYLLVVTILSLAATLVNYYGFDLWRQMFSMVGNQSINKYSIEWQRSVNEGWQKNVYFAVLLIIPLLTAWLKPKISLLNWIWFAGFGWMSLSAIRYDFWFVSVEVLLLGMMLGPVLDPVFSRKKFFQNRSINTITGILMLVIPFAFLPGLRGLWWQNATAVYQDTTPVKAAEWLKQNPQLPGELWSDFNYSTYLTYGLPERKLFMTNRFEDFPAEQFEDNDTITYAEPGWEEALQKYGINTVLASVLKDPKLIGALSSSPDWNIVYMDKDSYIFTRN